jgi:hypothetical protein
VEPYLSKKTNIRDFILRKKKRLEVLKHATKSSFSDITSKLERSVKDPGLKSSLYLGRSLFNSAAWVSKSSMRLLKPIEPSFIEKKVFLAKESTQYILKRVREKKSISYKKATYADIFKAVFYDFEVSHLEKSYQKVSKVPEIDSSVLLVSGVLNEIFSTPAFERGAKYIRSTYGIKFDYCPTSGTKTTQENSNLIKKHLNELLADEDKKVWAFAFSKGGIDFLHFLKEHGDEFGPKIEGLSTVASPLLGSERVNHKILKLINTLHQLEKNAVYKFLDKHFDLLFKDFQKSLSSDFQEHWFSENYSFLPRNMFYTALALESNWVDSHVWMVLTKLFFQSKSKNDGIVDVEKALYPDYFQGINLGIMKGHHLIGTRSSDYVQEALIEAHIVLLNYLGLLR